MRASCRSWCGGIGGASHAPVARAAWRSIWKRPSIIVVFVTNRVAMGFVAPFRRLAVIGVSRWVSLTVESTSLTAAYALTHGMAWLAWLAWLALLTTHGLALLTTHGLACLTTHHMTQPLAVVARHVARLLAHPLARRPLAEVLHQQVASTARRLLAVLPHAVQRLQLPLERLLRRVQLALRHRQQLFHARVVAPPVVQPAQRGLPVPPRLRLTALCRAHAPRLLVVALHGFGETGVDHEAHVLLVDAHAIGNGGAHHTHHALAPMLLHQNALCLSPLS